MNLLRIDSVGGASGDMLLASLIDLGADPDELRAGMETLGVEAFDLDVQTVNADGQKGTQVNVKVADAHHPHRHLQQVRDIIDSSGIDPAVKKMSIYVFERLATAEAAVHGTTAEAIHFHEVGAMDAIVDITGCCLALALLKIDAVTLGPLPLGTGTTQCVHGVMPLPVPATAELLKGHQVTHTDEPHELVTPTGAALLTTWLQRLPPSREYTETVVKKSGVGIGHRKLNGRPNMIRATLLETPGSDATQGSCSVIECNLDDTNPELLGSLAEQLMNDGALDVFTTPIQMKKQRPGTLLTVLSSAKDRERFINMIFAETTSFGIREYRVQRTMLARRHEPVETPYGQVRIKIGSRNGIDITQSPEHGDCLQCARLHNVSVRTVYEAAMRKTKDIMRKT